MVRQIISYSLIFISACNYSFGQKVSDELRKVSEAYLNTDNFSAEVEVVAFRDKNDSKGKRMGDGILRKTKFDYYSKYGNDEMVSNKNCTVIIDHEDRSITFFKGNEKVKAKDQQIPDMDSLLSKSDTVMYWGVQNGLKHFSIYSRNAIITRSEIFVDEKTYFLKRIIYYYHEAYEQEEYGVYKVDISYKNINTGKIDKNIFSENKYVANSNGNITLKPAYINYSLSVAKNEKL